MRCFWCNRRWSTLYSVCERTNRIRTPPSTALCRGFIILSRRLVASTPHFPDYGEKYTFVLMLLPLFRSFQFCLKLKRREEFFLRCNMNRPVDPVTIGPISWLYGGVGHLLALYRPRKVGKLEAGFPPSARKTATVAPCKKLQRTIESNVVPSDRPTERELLPFHCYLHSPSSYILLSTIPLSHPACALEGIFNPLFDTSSVKESIRPWRWKSFEEGLPRKIVIESK